MTSAEPESGKTTMLKLVAFLTPRCINTVEISKAALYRAIKAYSPSLCVDEFDDVLSSANGDRAELRSVINSGHTRGDGVLRCVTDEQPELFSTFCPKAIGLVGRKLPASTASRCIFVELRRRKRDEGYERFKHEDDAELNDLRSRLRRWAMDNADILREATPTMDAFFNRSADNWRLQFAIADLCSKDKTVDPE
jgi:putative DNA primase/helicase